MSLPSTAPVFPQRMDPTDVLDFYIVISQGNDGTSILMPDENILSYTLSLLPESMAAGLRLMTGSRAPVREDRNISFWLSIDPSMQSSTIFDAGVVLGFEITVVTDAPLARTKQRSFAVRIVNQ